MIVQSISQGEIFLMDKLFLEKSTPQYGDSSTMKGQEKEDDTAKTTENDWPIVYKDSQESVTPWVPRDRSV